MMDGFIFHTILGTNVENTHIFCGGGEHTWNILHVRTILYNRVTHVYEVIIVFTLPEIEPRASTCCPNGILLSNCFSPGMTC